MRTARANTTASPDLASISLGSGQQSVRSLPFICLLRVLRIGLTVAMVGLAGCASFKLPPYNRMAERSAARTAALRDRPLVQVALNRAAVRAGRSQAEIKQQLESLWTPSWRLNRLANYNGLVATRYSQLDTKPGPAFQPGSIMVRHLGRDTQVEYIAAFHRNRRLPVVVATSGINGTVDGKITVDILQDLYNSGEFHVVHLESVTSVSHESRNERPFAGGFPEGLLLYETVRELRAMPEYSGQISQVHLLGVSFGGLLCGLAGHCEDQFQEGVIDGAVLAFSPPLDLQQLFKNIAGFRYIHDRIHKNYLEDGLYKFESQGFVSSDIDPKRTDFDDYVRVVALPYVQQVYPALKSTFPDLSPIETAADVYAISSMQPYLGSLGVPYFYYYAYDDPVLSPADHFQKMLSNCSNPLVDGVIVPDGGHLGFDTIHDSPFTSRVALAYFRYWSIR